MSDVNFTKLFLHSSSKFIMEWFVFVSVLCRLCFLWVCGPTMAMASSFFRFQDHRQWYTTVRRTPPDEQSVCHRDLYLTTHNTHKWHSHTPGGIQTHNLSRQVATDLWLRLCGQWEWCYMQIGYINFKFTTRLLQHIMTSLFLFWFHVV
jgi:hypothetical protein